MVPRGKERFENVSFYIDRQTDRHSEKRVGFALGNGFRERERGMDCRYTGRQHYGVCEAKIPFGFVRLEFCFHAE